ncbi:hypothetical protein TNCV_745101 [Trichonephila clavipes]|nr:hypothetical protein TNCV_745101 [Trichonephila clavipes]
MLVLQSSDQLRRELSKVKRHECDMCAIDLFSKIFRPKEDVKYCHDLILLRAPEPQSDTQGIFYIPYSYITCVLMIAASRISVEPSWERTSNLERTKACSIHILSSSTMPIAAKLQEIDCGTTESSDPRGCAIDVHRVLVFCSKLTTFQRTG